MRRTITTFALLSPFLGSILFAHAWFNTDIGRSAWKSEVRNPNGVLTTDIGPQTSGSTSDFRPPTSGIWLQARTNILSGSFYRNDVDRSQTSEVGSQNSATRNRPSEPTSDLRPLTSGMTSDLRPLISGVTSDNRHPTSEQTSDLRFPTSARGLGTTNILSGSFYRNDVNRSRTSELSNPQYG